MNQCRFRKALAKYTLNPVVKAAAALGIRPPGVMVLETTGRKSGRRRRTPVGGKLEDGTIWLVSEHGRHAGYVRNIEANPRVRVKRGLRWQAGTARLVPEDDPRRRLREMSRSSLGLKLNALGVRVMATDPMTVRIELDRG
jgi:deazaflavin-dependent oxidoreductase (nitroreductase family)